MEREQHLIRRTQAGDRAAADALVRLYYDQISRFVSRQVYDIGLAQDLTQEILISMLRTIGYFQPGRASFSTWLYRIATNKVIDFYRARQAGINAVLVLDDLEPVDAADIARQVVDGDVAAQVLDRLAQCSTHLQQIFRWHVFGEHTFAQIGQELGIPENTVKTQYYRLVRRLRKEFAHDEA